MAKIKDEDESSDEEVLLGGDENEKKQNRTGQSTELDLDEITAGGSTQKNYIDMSQGKQAILTINKVNQVKSSKKYGLSSSEDDDGDPYKIEIVDTDGDVLSVNVWKLWGKIKQSYREALNQGLLNSPEGLTLKIGHPDRGEYEVAWSVDGSNWKEIADK